MKRCGIVLNNKGRHIREYKNYLAKNLKDVQIEVWCEDDRNITTDHTDLIIVLGGDGTTLRAFRKYLYLNVPFMCINFGTVGFLSSIEPQQFMAYLPRIINEEYQSLNRSILQVAYFRNNTLINHYHALNEVVIRSNKPKVCRQSVYIDGCLCLEVEGDGIICSTSTGSTAYSLSAGGPVVDCELDSIIVTPICSRNNWARSYVASPQRKVQIISNDTISRSMLIDGEELKNLSNGDMVIVKLAEAKAQFVQFSNDYHFNSLSLLSRKSTNLFD